jgi:transposase-like protein
MSRGYPPELRRKVLDLIAAGRPVRQVAVLLGVSDQTIYNWRRQHLTKAGQAPRIRESENAELIAARRRIAELENELDIPVDMSRGCSTP